MITLHIQNFQSIAQAELTVDGLTVLVGPSDRGKSAVVRALSGALFNTPGEFFVRTGTPRAAVTLMAAAPPPHAGAHSIVWTKGGGKNEFLVDGQLYAKVGVKAPDILRQLGFREELIGARAVEDEATGALKYEGGKWVRPQVAGQFDGIFLVDEPGPFINEVIIKLSRLGVLQRASRQCALDSRGTRSKLKQRREDLDLATARAESLAMAPLLRTRLDALIQLDDDAEVQRRTVIKLRELVARRAGAQQRLTLTLPAVQPGRHDEVSRAITDYQTLLKVRAQVQRRARLITLPTALPATRCAVDGPEVGVLQQALNQWQDLQQKVGARVMRVTALKVAEQAHFAAVAKAEAAAVSLQEFLAASPTCPVCTRPWAVGAAAV